MHDPTETNKHAKHREAQHEAFELPLRDLSLEENIKHKIENFKNQGFFDQLRHDIIEIIKSSSVFLFSVCVEYLIF